ncbi:hypothetical protein SynA1825c_01315 [Synechococcus sp. A18-25c]|nr:hypothetical protein SynA1825c_01315 [Synechococcus sp. A18-25c]
MRGLPVQACTTPQTISANTEQLRQPWNGAAMCIDTCVLPE